MTDGSYRLYVRLWCAAYPLRSRCFRLQKLAVAAARRLGVLPLLKKVLGKDGGT